MQQIARLKLYPSAPEDGGSVCDTSDELFVNQYASALTPSPSPNPGRGEQIRRSLRFFKGEEHKQCFSPSPEIGRGGQGVRANRHGSKRTHKYPTTVHNGGNHPRFPE
jgi:hypothetical protein